MEAKKTRLLDAYLAGDVEQEAFQEKNEGVKAELARVREEMSLETKVNAEFADMATAIFDTTQHAAKTWLGSNSAIRRELLDVLSLNRVLDETSLCLEWRKPFDALVEASKIEYGVANWTRHVPKVFAFSSAFNPPLPNYLLTATMNMAS